MKKILTTVFALIACSAVYAQYHYQDVNNSEMLRHSERHQASRNVIILPQVNGYNIYKADLHNHTVFSDGQVLPRFRVKEAWLDGLDVIAATDHIEHRPHEATFYKYLESYVGKDYIKPTDGLKSGKNMVDLNFVVREYQKEAEKYGILIIPGSEITRSGTKVGHFNALFTTDNNKIYDKDPVQAIRNAKAQDALVMHNHPGWRKKSLDYTPAEKKAYDEGLIDGVEVMNGAEFYPGIIDRVREKSLFIAANTDIHASTAEDYRANGHQRNMTLILAKEKSLEAIREAMEAKRTIAWGFDNLCGDEQLLRAFFLASVKVVPIGGGKYEISNVTSVPYVIRQKGSNILRLDEFSALILNSKKGSDVIKFTVLNMWTGTEEHLEIEINTKNI